MKKLIQLALLTYVKGLFHEHCIYHRQGYTGSGHAGTSGVVAPATEHFIEPILQFSGMKIILQLSTESIILRCIICRQVRLEVIQDVAVAQTVRPQHFPRDFRRLIAVAVKQSALH